jgi:hypothetical protein
MKFACVVLSLLLLCGAGSASEVRSRPQVADQELLLPANYHEWVKLSPATAGLPQHKHKHVASQLFVEPKSFEHFRKTGQWPDHTVIVLELSSAKPSTAKEVMGLEAAVKNDAQFPETWTYYGIVYDRPQQPARALKPEKPCDCDETLDSMLAMAFPTLRAVINAKPSTMSPTSF